jgi:predicted glycogen debranching enzyme
MPAQSSQSESDQQQFTSQGEYRIDPSTPVSTAREWVVPNGSGGFAMGPAGGLAHRRYHSLMTSSLHPPVMRMNLLATIDERLTVELPDGPKTFHLTPIRFVGAKANKSCCTRFEKTPFGCVWIYELPAPDGSIIVRKSLSIADQHSASRVSYTVESDHPWSIEARPLLAMRDFHALNTPGTIRATDLVSESISDSSRIARGSLAIRIKESNCTVHHEGTVWNGIEYTSEQDRGLDFVEDLYCPLVFRTDRNCSIEFVLEGTPEFDWESNRAEKTDRLFAMVSAAYANAGEPEDPRVRQTLSRLAIAADDFVVRRIHGLGTTTSIIAGYPWFSDWGRDSMISLPGLLLVTGRHEEALGVLQIFAAAQRDGLIPNRFDDREGEAHYNTVDASLWFVHACVQYAQTANDLEGFARSLLDPCRRVIEAYKDSTAYNIGVDPADGLVAAGNEQTQLTWMDAQRDGITFTPRHGKPIEINALWINALEQLAALIESNDSQLAATYRRYAEEARRSLMATMTGGNSGGLVDCLTPTSQARSVIWRRYEEVRPNQAFAISLPSVGLDQHIGDGVLEAIRSQLLTGVGLRTLTPTEKAFCAHYEGPLIDRDRAYHNGTVWPWLLGAHCEADMRVNSFDSASCKRTIDMVCALSEEMLSGTPGSIAEIYDAQPGSEGKHAQRGCPAQAWSIAELLRVLVLGCSS